MRFRYFDSEGTEVGLSSVDALRFRIQKGVVTPETLLYDAAAGQWAPARQNPLFRFLVEEDENLLPEEYRDLMAGGESPSSSSGSETGSAIRWSSPRPDFDVQDLDAAVGESLESLEETPHENGTAEAEDLLPFLDEPLQEATPTEVLEDESAVSEDESTFSEQDRDFPDPGPAIPNEAWEPSGDARTTEAPSRPDRRPAPGPTDPPVRHSSFPMAPREADEPPHGVAPDRKSPYSESTDRDRYSRRRRARPSLAGVAALSILLVFVAGIPLLVLGGGQAGEDGTAYALVGGLADDLVPDEGTPEGGGEVDEASAEREDRESIRDDGSTTAAVSPTGPERLGADEIERLAADVDAAASEDLEDALANLRIALRVPQTPPAEWLQGRYLAEAPSFSGVERYWVAFASLVTSMSELEGELYRGFLQSRIPGTGLHTADQAQISALALQRHDRRSQERAALYRDLELLASSAIALHDTLVARSDDITDRAFDGTTLTRYPFMAAAPDDPVLAEHIWSRVDVILDVIHDLDGARPTSVTELRAAVRRETPGGAGDPLDELPDWWPRPTDRRGTSDPAASAPNLPEPGDLPVPTQEVVIPD